MLSGYRSIRNVNRNPPQHWNEMKDLIREFDRIKNTIFGLQHEIDSTRDYVDRAQLIDGEDKDYVDTDRDIQEILNKLDSIKLIQNQFIQDLEIIAEQIEDISARIYRLHMGNRPRAQLVKSALQYLFTRGGRRWVPRHSIMVGIILPQDLRSEL